MLTEAQVARYRRDGYLFPFPVLSTSELAECNDGLARFEDWLGKPVNQGDFRWRSASYPRCCPLTSYPAGPRCRGSCR